MYGVDHVLHSYYVLSGVVVRDVVLMCVALREFRRGRLSEPRTMQTHRGLRNRRPFKNLFQTLVVLSSPVVS